MPIYVYIFKTLWFHKPSAHFIKPLFAFLQLAARGVFGKKQMSGAELAKNLSAENYYAVLTIISFSMLVPVTMVAEGPKIFKMMENLHDSITREGLISMLISGVLFYLYNEVSFKALNSLDPVSHALSNTLKRIVIIISSVIIFNEKLDERGVYSIACMHIID